MFGADLCLNCLGKLIGVGTLSAGRGSRVPCEIKKGFFMRQNYTRNFPASIQYNTGIKMEGATHRRRI